MGTPKVICMVLLAVVAASNIAEATWCVVRSGASAGALQAGLNWACSHGADCGPIRPGGSCFNPNTIQNHASYAYDSYYQRNGKAPSACNFGGTATIAVSDPSFGGCRYPPIESVGRAEDATTTKSFTEDSTN
ncbi:PLASMODESMATA CALLOSE-BINDING PROTEIN 3-like [Arachis duranensis]|uniref:PLASMODESMATA CALLOSE-BINDING PROTEIN 3-like n=1 Tax=Arachis duranensis TaxID=130453 RepID=A0A6P4D251_ARADU|nr:PLASMODESMATA CALLOSE-BINDING PROTEIN 3-like [Arachis duranensis]